MEFSGIYEPITRTMDPGIDSTHYFRSVTIDTDGIRDAVHAAEKVMSSLEHVEEVRTTVTLVPVRPHQTHSVVPLDALDGLGEADRNRIQFRVEGYTNNMTIADVHASIVRGQRPNVFSMRYHGWEDASATLAGAIIRSMLDNGRPRIDRYKLLRFAAFLPAAALAATAVWLQVSFPSPPGVLFAWLTVAVVVAGTTIYYRYLSSQQGSRSVGVHVIMENREKTASRRADRKRDILSGVIGLVTGILLALLTFWLTQLGHDGDPAPQAPTSTVGASTHP